MTKSNMACPTVMRLNFSYDAKTGIIKRLKSGRVVKSGSFAFNASSSKGYLRGGFRNCQEKAHRVAWCIAYGEWPIGPIDHINGDRTDNRIENLRVVTNQDNSRNQKIRATNKSGVMGVYWHNLTSKWTAQIMHGGKRLHLGLFNSKQDAIIARLSAEAKFGYHENHGAR